ncbi:MAG: hypothetical protein ACP5F1_05975 [Thermoplasmata archaeon]|nr:hypothetical protein [Thermoplasmata archaeon]
MAKKEDDEEIVLPELSEKDFLNSEMHKGKAYIISYMIGIGVGFLSGFLESKGLAVLSYLLGFVFAIILPYLIKYAKLNIDRKNLAYDIIVFLASWITFWIVALNPPFF